MGRSEMFGIQLQRKHSRKVSFPMIPVFNLSMLYIINRKHIFKMFAVIYRQSSTKKKKNTFPDFLAEKDIVYLGRLVIKAILLFHRFLKVLTKNKYD